MRIAAVSCRAAVSPSQNGAAPADSKCLMLRMALVRDGVQMADYWIWWLLAALLVGLELATGTFYLLAVGIAFALGGVVALIGASIPVQLLVGGILSAVGLALANRWRTKHGKPTRQASLDRGQPVTVDAWNADGTARVQYRGTQWTARLQPGAPQLAGAHRVTAVEGNWLVLAPSPTS